MRSKTGKNKLVQRDRKFPGTKLAVNCDDARPIRHFQTFLLGEAKDDIANMVRVAPASLRERSAAKDADLALVMIEPPDQRFQ